MKKNKGFTLIELLVVISIISLFSSVVLASLNTARAKARDAQRISSVQEINKAIQLYILNHNGAAPFYNEAIGGTITSSNLDTWTQLENVLRPYISSLPQDPCPKCSHFDGEEQFGDYLDSKDLRYVYVFCDESYVDEGRCSDKSVYWIYPSGFETKDSNSFTGFNNGITY